MVELAILAFAPPGAAAGLEKLKVAGAVGAAGMLMGLMGKGTALG